MVVAFAGDCGAVNANSDVEVGEGLVWTLAGVSVTSGRQLAVVDGAVHSEVAQIGGCVHLLHFDAQERFGNGLLNYKFVSFVEIGEILLIVKCVHAVVFLFQISDAQCSIRFVEKYFIFINRIDACIRGNPLVLMTPFAMFIRGSSSSVQTNRAASQSINCLQRCLFCSYL